MAEFKSDLSDTELDDVQPVPIPQITVESLLQHIKSLTNNQNELIGLYRSTNNVAFIAVQNHSETSIEINANELKLSNDLDKEIENDPFDLTDLPKTVDPAKYTFRDDHMNDEEKHALKKVINNYRDVLYVETDKLSFTHKIKHNVRTVDNVPVHSKSYKYPYVYESENSSPVTPAPIVDQQHRPQRHRPHHPSAALAPPPTPQPPPPPLPPSTVSSSSSRALSAAPASTLQLQQQQQQSPAARAGWDCNLYDLVGNLGKVKSLRYSRQRGKSAPADIVSNCDRDSFQVLLRCRLCRNESWDRGPQDPMTAYFI
ncbi:arp2/3 complex-activating protein rickA-like [Sabethes cyaneus]|uniref:arp2/3 complex-activating protein rickA-like n=1 Tax=Sabethes cyaneus TaxID=53552 RepID=UPI00237EDA41|nr:arp2/3 complex-activating protein rickA-like [Sabethes cyaneus]